MQEQRASLTDFQEACLVIDLSVFRLKADITMIGRQPDNDCVINHPTVSHRHAKVVLEDGTFVLYDLDSTVGTFVNNERIEKQILRTGDIILFGSFPVMFMYEDPEMVRKHEMGTMTLTPP